MPHLTPVKSGMAMPHATRPYLENGKDCFDLGEGAGRVGTAPSRQTAMETRMNQSEGLQLADLTARPIGLSVLRPNQANRARSILEKKFYRDDFGRIEGFGLKCFP